jgi:hypothetical protein
MEGFQKKMGTPAAILPHLPPCGRCAANNHAAKMLQHVRHCRHPPAQYNYVECTGGGQISWQCTGGMHFIYKQKWIIMKENRINTICGSRVKCFFLFFGKNVPYYIPK